MNDIAFSEKTRIGIDFGTTNSVVVIRQPGGSTRTASFKRPDATSAETCRTLLCFWHEESQGRSTRQHAIGAEAIEAYLDDPAESRLIMSMKSYLAQASFRETQIFGQRMTLESLIASFLRELMAQAGVSPGSCAVTVGRPIRFVGDGADDALGERRLLESFSQAGFTDVSTLLEPEAAGWKFAQRLTSPATVLVADFGGGTSDFSVMRFDPASGKPPEALGHAGVGLAGDQFDYRIIDHIVSPLLGRDSVYRVMGGSPLPVPIEWYTALARWHRLSLMRTPKTLNDMAEVARGAAEPELIARLIELVREQNGQTLYRAVSDVKSALSSSDRATLRFSQKNFSIEQEVTREAFEQWIAPDLAQFEDSVSRALARAQIDSDDIDRVFMTGGTSFVPAVRALFTRRFGEEKVELGGEFVSVAEGLALANHA